MKIIQIQAARDKYRNKAPNREENKVKNHENQNEKDEIIQKINDVLSVLEYERLEEVLKYVKRKKNQKK